MLPQKIMKFVKESLAVVSDEDINAVTLTEGRSGADVYRIKVVSRRDRLTGNYIVKVCNKVKGEEEKEFYKANILYQKAPNFSEHLVKVEAEKMIDGRSVITEIEQTHGKILLDKLNLDVTFVPKPLSVGEDPSRIFSREDINCPVKLNIMFAYSGLRGWKVVKI